MAGENRRDVVVTGLGTTSPLGGDVPSTWQAALEGRSGARTLTHDWVTEHGLPVTFACSVAVDPSEQMARHEQKRLDPSGQYAVIAAREAWADAGSPDVERERLGVAMATGIGGVWTLLSSYDTLKERGPRRVLPNTVPMLMPNGAAGAVSIDLGAAAGAHSPVSACASGAEGIAYAMDMIRSGRADVVVAGGTEAAIHALPISGFAAMHALSTRNEAPELASRPWDTARDGFVLGEGAGAVVLETAEHAAARGARVYAHVVSAGMTADAHHIAIPDPEGAGATRAMRQALADGDIGTDEIIHVNAHATSTPAGDVAEAAALRSLLGSGADRVAVTSTKSMTGHLLGASGALESIFTVLALYHGVVPPTINLDELDPKVDLDIVRTARDGLGAGVAMNNSFGFGGHNVALAFRSV